jgi:beta-lactam-binding protein with PASTA domain
MFDIATPAGAGELYKYSIVARTGSSTGLVAMSAPSINDNGTAAFTGYLDGGSSIFVGDGSRDPRNITPGHVRITEAFWGPVQINDSEQVVSVHRASGNPMIFSLRIWDADPNYPDLFGTAARSGTEIDDFSSFASPPSINDNLKLEHVISPGGNDNGECDPGETCIDQVVFSGLKGGSPFLSTVLETPPNTTAPGLFKIIGPLDVVPSPMLANDGRICVSDTKQIVLHSYDLDPGNTKIVSESMFDVVGLSPGISDSGKIAAFVGMNYGDTVASVFASVENEMGYSKPVRIAGGMLPQQTFPDDLGINDDGNPISFIDIDDKQRIAVIHYELGDHGLSQDTFIVAFIGTPSSKSPMHHTPGISFTEKPGLWTIRVDIKKASNDPTGFGYDFKVHRPLPVYQIGDEINEFPTASKPRVKSIEIHDPIERINDLNMIENLNLHDIALRNLKAGSHRLAFKVTTDTNDQAIILAEHKGGYILPIRTRYQFDEPWGIQTINDHPNQNKLSSVGCRVTAVAMQLNHVAQNYLRSDNPISWKNIHPGQLNAFCRLVDKQPIDDFAVPPEETQRNGFLKGTPGQHSTYGNIDPYAAVRLISTWYLNIGSSMLTYIGQQGQSDGGSAPIPDDIKRQLYEALARHNAPVEVRVRGSGGDFKHSVLVTGVANGEFFIADVGHRTRKKLSAPRDHDHPGSENDGYENRFQLRGYVMDQAHLTEPLGSRLNTLVNAVDPPDMGYLTFSVMINAELEISNSLGQTTGFIAGDGESLMTEILASTAHKDVTSDLYGLLEPLGPAWKAAINSPNTDTYQVKVRGLSDGPFSLEIRSATPTGNTGTLNEVIKGVAVSGAETTYEVTYDTLGESEVELVSTPVPTLFSLPQAEAVNLLKVAGLTTGKVSFQSSDTVPSGSVASQAPSAGTIVGPGTPVDFVVSSGPVAEVTVPNVVGLTQANAQAAITAAGLTVGNVTTQSSATVPAGSVIGQSPAAGASVDAGSKVDLVVSTVPVKVTVPNAVGLTQANAQAAITAAGLTVGSVTNQSSATVPAGSVISQNPAAGGSVNAGSKVDLVVSSGSVAKVTVPNVVGLTQANAQTAITGAGLAVGSVTNQSSATVPTGAVISQNPAAGASVDAGAKVDFVVSSGTAKITVPDVVGLTQSNAETAITGAGLSVGTVSTESSQTVPFGSVISQDPEAGTAVDSGSEVDFIVSSGHPNFTLSNTPNKDTWVTDGAVWAIVPDGSKTYIGGTFNYVGPQTGGGVPLDITTGKPKGVFPRVEGEVYAVAADGAGGWYIGGNFTRVGGLIRNRIAHITQEGVVDASWNPDADAPVRALAVNGATVFAGGDFANIGGRGIYHLTALDASTGQAIDWNPNGCFVVSALALGGNTLYVGGPPGAVAYDATTGAQTSWLPVNGPVYALAVSGSTVYIGGNFAYVGPEGEKLPRKGLAAVDGVTGVATPWNPSPNNLPVTALATDGKTVYAGGYFWGIGGEYRNYLAALDAATGQATPWDPNPDGNGGGYVTTLAVSGDTVYAGGWFTRIGGELRTYVAALDASTGKATSWKGGANGFVNALAVSGSTLYTGGSFMSAGGEYRQCIAALDSATGEATSWNPSATYSKSPHLQRVYALAPSGNTVYVGGIFDEIGGQSRSAVAAMDAVTGQATPWNPNVQGRIGVAPVPAVVALAVNGETIYVGGTFSEIGGQNRNNIAALDTSTGLARAWDPDARLEGSELPPVVRSLLVNGSTIYAGGLFNNIGANRPTDHHRYGIAALDAATGEATPWDPNPTSDADVWRMVLSGSTLYVGGVFSSMGGKLRNNIAALDVSTEEAKPWNPNANGAVLALALNDTTVYAGGSFTSIGGVMRSGLAALDAVTGYATSWTPLCDPNDPDGVCDVEVIQAMAMDGTRLYLGHGHSSEMNEMPLHYLIRFDEAPQPVVPGAPTMRKAVAGNASAAVSFNAPASDGGSPITSYTVTSSPGGLTASGETSPISIGGLTDGTEYTFTVRAANAVGAGPESNSSNAVTPLGPPGAPTDVNAKAGSTQATVTFSAPDEDGGSPITSYIVTSYPGRITKIGTGSPMVVSGLTNGTAYKFRVQAGNAMGKGPASVASKKVLVGAPDAPAEVSAIAGYRQATVSFNPPPPNGTSPVTSYMVTVYPGRSTKTGTGSPIVITGLTNGKSYEFQVKARNSSGWGPLSARSNKVTPSTTAPGAPTRVRAFAGNAQAKVRFTPPVYTGGSPITSYTVTSNPGNLTASGASSPMKVKGLTNGTAYTFTVTATNAVATGPSSKPSNSVTPVAPSVAPTSPKDGQARK